jgi:hypothetical protein
MGKLSVAYNLSMDQHQELFNNFPPLEQKIVPHRRRWPKILIWLVIILGTFFAFFLYQTQNSSK